MRNAGIRRALMAAGGMALAVGSVAISGSETAAKPPVSSGLREVSADLSNGTLTITRVCQDGHNVPLVDVEATIESDYLGTGTLMLDEELAEWGLSRRFEIETNKGYLHGTPFPVGQATYVGADSSSSPWGHLEWWRRYDLNVDSGTGGQFDLVSHSGALLQISRIFFESNEFPPPECGTQYTEPIVGPPGETPRLYGAMTFDGRGVMMGAGSGTAVLDGDVSTDAWNSVAINEVLTVEFPSVEPCDDCTPTADHGEATMSTTFTTQAANDWFAEQLGVDTSVPSTVEIVGPDRDKKPGPDWTLSGYVYRSGFGQPPWAPLETRALDRVVKITRGTGDFAEVSTGVLHYFNAQYTITDNTPEGHTALVESGYGPEFQVWGFIG